MSESTQDQVWSTIRLAAEMVGPVPCRVADLATYVMALPGGPLAERAA